MPASDHLIIFDTTLRDGEQSPGASMTKGEKLRIARVLEKLRVDVIEAGFAIASQGDFEAVKSIAETIKDSTVCSLARALDKDIDRAAEAVRPAPRSRIHTFIATSPIHMKHKLQMQPDEVVEQAVRSIKRARSHVEDVEFSCEDARHIVPASRLVSTITGFPVQPNKAIVGANAFAHESGIHQDGVLKHRETYEIMRAQDVGWHTNSLVLGKHSGRNAFRSRLLELGIQFDTETELNEAFTRFKAMADLKHEIFDEDLQAIASDTRQKEEEGRFGLVCMQVCSETGVVPRAFLTLTMDGSEHKVESEGSGPVDATFKAIETLVDSGCNLQLYSVNNITSGTDAQGDVTVRLERGGRIVNGIGVDTDIIIASAKAYIEALNLITRGVERRHPQGADV